MRARAVAAAAAALLLCLSDWLHWLHAVAGNFQDKWITRRKKRSETNRKGEKNTEKAAAYDSGTEESKSVSHRGEEDSNACMHIDIAQQQHQSIYTFSSFHIYVYTRHI